MVTAPVATPVTSPDDEFTEARALLVLHAPPVVASFNNISENLQTSVGPVMGDNGFTDTVVVYIVDGLQPGNALLLTVNE